MKNLQYREQRRHGLPDFPVQYYRIDREHPRYEMNLHWHRELEIVRVLHGELSLYLDNTDLQQTIEFFLCVMLPISVPEYLIQMNNRQV